MQTLHYIVDRNHPLPADYIPEDLETAPIPFLCPPDDPKRLICHIVSAPLLKLYNDSILAGLTLRGISGYRSYKRQQELYLASIIKNGVKHTSRYIASPGTSEHQTGLAIDLSCPDVDYELTEEFENTREGKWLLSNCEKYGFRISYPKNCESDTGYGYEPWHICFTCNDAGYFVY